MPNELDAPGLLVRASQHAGGDAGALAAPSTGAAGFGEASIRWSDSEAGVAGFRNTLGPLADPLQFCEPLRVPRGDLERARRLLRCMLVIRLAEEAIAQLVERKEAVCPCHLGIGQEAVAAGVSEHLNPRDRVFGAHRSHSHYLALGGGIEELMAEVLGKATGTSKGMGGSMHLYGPAVGFHGSVPIVAATIPIAVGAALACKMDARGAVAVSYFGDGAAEEGVLHESLNLAAALSVPVLFVCENNLFSSHLDIHLRQPQNRIARFADAHSVPAEVVDGNDVLATSRAASRLLHRLRTVGGPAFLEAVTYRHRGHVGANADIDVGVRRNPNELAAWLRRDPVRRLRDGMIETGLFSLAEYGELERAIRQEAAEAVELARGAPYPPVENLRTLVYSEPAS